MTRLLPLAALALSLLLVGCADEPQSGATPPATAAWMLSAAPSDAVGVAALKASAQEGDQVTMTGRIGGRRKPVSAESGLMVVMDAAIASCAEKPEENCPTPWDYCCVPQENLTANAATVQLRDADGEPIVLAEANFPPLSIVTVTGTVGARPNADVLVLLADAVHVAPR